MNYAVTWSIEVEAESAREAARAALAAQRDPASLAVVFDVTGPRGLVPVDLGEDNRRLFGGRKAERGPTCRHCGRAIAYDYLTGYWVDPEATGDDGIWRETCDEHDTFTAEHEPYEAEGSEA